MPFSYHNSNVSIPPRMVDGAGFGKTAIITGCASGVGLATTQLFLSRQYQVFGVDIREMDYGKIDEKDQERFHFHRADLMNEDECDEVVRICVAQYGYVLTYCRMTIYGARTLVLID
jgi:NAD(P)-dependent dehydrogenase (short-subunit alcohol dehydrogenase family)